MVTCRDVSLIDEVRKITSHVGRGSNPGTLAEDEVNFAIEYAMPYFDRSVETRLVRDDGSDRWLELHDRAAEEPVVIDEPAL